MIGDEKQLSTVTDSSCTLFLSLTIIVKILRADTETHPESSQHFKFKKPPPPPPWKKFFPNSLG